MRINLASTRLAFVLIAALIVLIVLSAIIPQKDIAQDQILDWRETLGDAYVVIETLALDRIYFAPYFFILLGLLAVNLTIGNIRRFRIIYRTGQRLIQARHLGSIIFHLSLLIIMFGVILNYLFKFEAVYALSEGQTATDDAATQFRSFTGPLYRHEPGRYAVTLEKVDPDFDVAGTSAYAATIAVVPGGAEVPIRATVHTNNPLALNGLEFHYGLRSGFSPEVTLRDTTGATLLRGVVRLATQGSMNAPVYADFVQLPELGLKLNLKIEPGDKGGLDTPCRVAVTEEGEALYDGILRPGDTARFGAYELAIPRLRRWCYIDVVESPFLNLVFIGFWTALAGMVITFIPRLVKRGGAG